MRTMVFAACLVIVGLAPANAQPVDQRIAALSVSKSEIDNGQMSPRLQARIESAVNDVCGSSADNLDQFTDLARCRKAARAAIAAQLARSPRTQMAESRK